MIALCAALTLTLQGSPGLLLAMQQEPEAKQSQEKPPESGEGDIDLLPNVVAPDAAQQRALESQLRTRRQMLQLHQLSGMLTFAALGATVIFGQLNYNDIYGGGGATHQWYDWHKWSAFTATALFATTGALAIFAPSPLEKPMRLDTAMLHRISMGVATAGMVTQIVLGFVTASKNGSISQRDFALAHQIVGYTTFAAYAVGFGVLTF